MLFLPVKDILVILELGMGMSDSQEELRKSVNHKIKKMFLEDVRIPHPPFWPPVFYSILTEKHRCRK